MPLIQSEKEIFSLLSPTSIITDDNIYFNVKPSHDCQWYQDTNTQPTYQATLVLSKTHIFTDSSFLVVQIM